MPDYKKTLSIIETNLQKLPMSSPPFVAEFNRIKSSGGDVIPFCLQDALTGLTPGDIELTLLPWADLLRPLKTCGDPGVEARANAISQLFDSYMPPPKPTAKATERQPERSQKKPGFWQRLFGTAPQQIDAPAPKTVPQQSDAPTPKVSPWTVSVTEQALRLAVADLVQPSQLRYGQALLLSPADGATAPNHVNIEGSATCHECGAPIPFQIDALRGISAGGGSYACPSCNLKISVSLAWEERYGGILLAFIPATERRGASKDIEVTIAKVAKGSAGDSR